jgi:AcrR family transcriptional regulator
VRITKLNDRANFVKLASDDAEKRRRSDGERTHATILEAATRLASVEGLEGLTIGRLAEELGVSKSGVYAHFGSKQQLQLETIEAAQAIFADEVMRPALQAPQGLGQLEALCEAYLSYIERLVFPGGCFFASLLAEMDARSGPIHEGLLAGERAFVDGLEEMVRAAQRSAEIAGDADPGQLAFELQAAIELANYHFVLFRDRRELERARTATHGILERARTAAPQP